MCLAEDQHAVEGLAAQGADKALAGRVQESGQLNALTEARDVTRTAIAATPAPHPRRRGFLSNLSACLVMLAGRTGDRGALTDAVGLAREAFHQTPAEDPAIGACGNALGDALLELFEVTGDTALAVEARAICQAAAESASAEVRQRVMAYRGMLRAAMATGETALALSAAESAVALLPRITLGYLSRRDREHDLGGLAGLAAEAASAAVAAGQPTRAVELLEQARGTLLSEAIAMRGGVAELRAAAPGLAAELDRLRDAMNASDLADSRLSSSLEMVVDAGFSPTAARRRQQQAALIAERRRRLSGEWDQLATQIRALPGFRDSCARLPSLRCGKPPPRAQSSW